MYTFFCGHKFAVPFGIYLTVKLLGHIVTCGGFPGGVVVKNLPASAGDPRDTDSVPGSGRSPGEGNGNPLQYSSPGNPMDRGAWQATVHGVAKSQT